MISGKIERYGPYLLATLAAGTLACFASEIESFPRTLAAGSMTLGVVVAGFTATQRNMLLGMGGARVLRFAVKTGYYKNVLRYLGECVYVGLIVTVVSAVCVLVSWYTWLKLGLWGGSVVLVLALIARNEWLMFLIIKRFMEEQTPGKK